MPISIGVSLSWRSRCPTAPLAIGSGANVEVVQRLGGHATAAMTFDRYGRRLNDDLSGVADALGKAIDITRYPCDIRSRNSIRDRP